MLSKTITVELENHFSSYFLYKVRNQFEVYKDEFNQGVRGILFSYDPDVFKKTTHFFTSLELSNKGRINLLLHNIPLEISFFNQLLQYKEDHIISALRDIFFTRHLEEGEPISSYVLEFVRNTNLLDVEYESANPLGRVMIQGGHRIPKNEKRHHQKLGFQLGVRGFDIVTGSGSGAMKYPFKGAVHGYVINRKEKKKLIGITEQSILNKETCNAYNNPLVIFPDIEKRLEAFIRMTKGGIILPGGVGTFEEILIFLSIKLNPKNKDHFSYPLFFVEPKTEKLYFPQIFEFFKESVGQDILDLEDVVYYQTTEDTSSSNSIYQCIDEFSQKLLQAKELDQKYCKEQDVIYSHLWNYHLHYPENLQNSFPKTQFFFDTIMLSSKIEVSELLLNLRLICSLYIETSIRDPEFTDKNGMIEIWGEKKIIDAFDVMIQYFLDQGRIPGNFRHPVQWKIIS